MTASWGDTTMIMTNHCEVRAQQRGIQSGELELILNHGTEVPGGYLLRNKDIRRAARFVSKSVKQKLERLSGRILIIDGDVAITVYPARRTQQRRLLQKRHH
jgi:hypothetical protein